MEPVLGMPGTLDDRSRRATLPLSEGIAKKRVMPVVPGRFDEDASQMRVAGFGDGAARLFSPARVIRTGRGR